MDELLLLPGRPIICGDFNCPGRDSASIDQQLSDMLIPRSLAQSVCQPTHDDGNVLDLLITAEHTELLGRLQPHVMKSTKPLQVSVSLSTPPRQVFCEWSTTFRGPLGTVSAQLCWRSTYHQRSMPSTTPRRPIALLLCSASMTSPWIGFDPSLPSGPSRSPLDRRSQPCSRARLAYSTLGLRTDPFWY